MAILGTRYNNGMSNVNQNPCNVSLNAPPVAALGLCAKENAGARNLAATM